VDRSPLWAASPDPPEDHSRRNRSLPTFVGLYFHAGRVRDGGIPAPPNSSYLASSWFLPSYAHGPIHPPSLTTGVPPEHPFPAAG